MHSGPILRAVRQSANSTAQREDLLTPEEVMATFPGRWASKRTLAASNVPGRVNVSPTRAAYRRDVFLSWAEEQRQKAPLFHETMKARAAHARAARAAKRGAAVPDPAGDAIVSLATALEDVLRGGA